MNPRNGGRPMFDAFAVLALMQAEAGDGQHFAMIDFTRVPKPPQLHVLLSFVEGLGRPSRGL